MRVLESHFLPSFVALRRTPRWWWVSYLAELLTNCAIDPRSAGMHVMSADVHTPNTTPRWTYSHLTQVCGPNSRGPHPDLEVWDHLLVLQTGDWGQALWIERRHILYISSVCIFVYREASQVTARWVCEWHPRSVWAKHQSWHMAGRAISLKTGGNVERRGW